MLENMNVLQAPEGQTQSHSLKGQSYYMKCILIQSLLLFLFQQASCWFDANMGHWNAWEWERNIRGSRIICHQTFILKSQRDSLPEEVEISATAFGRWHLQLLASCDVSLSYNSVGVIRVLEECGRNRWKVGAVVVEDEWWLKMSGERAVIFYFFMCMWPLLRPRSI